MSVFKLHLGSEDRLDLKIGPALGAWDCDQFAHEIRDGVESVLGISFDPKRNERTARGGYIFWFSDSQISASLFVQDAGEGFPLDKVPVDLEVRSEFYGPEDWQLAEFVYNGLDALGKYLLIAMTHRGTLITANFDVGDSL
ncbi:hypothetical protein [Streptomyces sp. CAU 1734]|uniref:hypothetical protein n=1 Tax=Streptomyces sp. CAU 1734 TaxID=3140360 RepID=UPI0032608B7B